MGLLLRPDAYCAETAEGAHILTHEGELAFTGGSVYQLIDRLTPYLDGRHSLAELTGELPRGRRELVERLITALLERGVVRDVASEPGVYTGGHPHEVAFAGYFLDSPEAAFQAYQDAETLVVGSGRLGRAVAHAAVRSGLRHVRVATTPEGAPVPAGSGWTAEPGWPDPGLPEKRVVAAIRSVLAGVDLVLHVSDKPMVERADLLGRLCAEAGVRLAHALVAGDHAWICGVESEWASGRRRLLARRPGSLPAAEAPSAPPDAASATVVASRLVHGVFRSITGSAEPSPNRMTRVDLATLAGEECAFLPHPYATHGAPVTGPASPERTGDRLTEETFSRRAATCTGDRTGVFGEPAEREFAQIPLHVCEIEVSDPAGLLDPGGPPPKAIGAGLDFATARYRAALQAFAVYGSLMVDPRRLIIRDGPADPGEALRALMDGRRTGALEGNDLVDGTAHLVGAARVFPALRATASPYAPPPGVAAAYSWQEAVTLGMLGHCLRLTMSDLRRADAPFPVVDVAGAPLDERGDRYRALLGAIGEPIAVYDVTGPLGVPTMLCYLGGEPAGRASALSATDAMTDALEQALLRHQARENDQRDYAPPPVAPIPDRLRATTARPISDAPISDAPVPGDAALAALADRGYRPIAVPLDHDPEVHAVMPYIVHVVIADE